MGSNRTYLFALGTLALAGVGALMGFVSPQPKQPTGNPVVVELFTSQSCSSCPPAEALFSEYAKRSDIVSLEWHVDYWNKLSVGEAGRWKDPYSSPEWTERQRVYNQRIRGQDGVYTPQAVIAGVAETVGSRPDAVDGLIRSAAAKAALRVSVTPTGLGLSATATGASASAEFFVVTFRKLAETEVGGGENHGRKLNSAHLVIGMQRVSPGLAFPSPSESEGCAVIVQEQDQGRVLGGAYCPTTR